MPTMDTVWSLHSRHASKVFILIVWKIQTPTGGKLLLHNLILEITESPSREAKPLNIPAHNFFSQYWVALIFLPLLNEEVTFGENICTEHLPVWVCS